MALFTDPGVVTLDDLLQFENTLVQISTTHGIDVDTKIALALNAISDKLTVWLLNAGGSDPQFLYRRSLGLSTVVVTAPLYRWICFDSLSRFFEEAYNVQLNTRFQGKWTEYQQQASDAADMVFMSGVGIVYSPLPKPGMPVIQIGPGSTLSESLFVQTTWVDNKGNESAPSPVNGQLVANFSSVSVIASGEAPVMASGWNAYASTTNGNLQLQNTTPLAINGTWRLPAAGLAAGAPPSSGQQPNFYVALTRRIQRG